VIFKRPRHHATKFRQPRQGVPKAVWADAVQRWVAPVAVEFTAETAPVDSESLYNPSEQREEPSRQRNPCNAMANGAVPGGKNLEGLCSHGPQVSSLDVEDQEESRVG
jgi:hypothetical protein